MRRRLNQDLDEVFEFGEKFDAFSDDLGAALRRMRSYGLLDPSLAPLLDAHLAQLRAQEKSGAIPPLHVSRLTKGDLVVGKDPKGRDVRIERDWLNSHGLVLGGSGSGKTSIMMPIAAQIVSTGARNPFWVVESAKQEWRGISRVLGEAGIRVVVLQPHRWRANLLQPVGTPSAHLARTVQVFATQFDLHDRAKAILREGIHHLYKKFGIYDGSTCGYPTLYDLWNWIKNANDLHHQSKEAVLSRIASFLLAAGPGCCAWRVGWDPRSLERYSAIFEITRDRFAGRILVEHALHGVFNAAVDEGLYNGPMKLTMILEDAQLLLGSADGSSYEHQSLSSLQSVVRGVGYALMFVVTDASALSTSVLSNVTLKLVGTGANRNFELMKSEMGLESHQVAWAKHGLVPGTFIAQISRGPFRHPFVLHGFPPARLPVVSDEEVAETVSVLESELPSTPAPEFFDWDPHAPIQVSTSTEEKAGDYRRTESAKNRDSIPQLTRVELEYLASIATDPCLSLTERDARLGHSAGKAHRLRGDLLDRGLAEKATIPRSGRGRSIAILGLTSAGRDVLHAFDIPLPAGRGGTVHTYYCHVVAGCLRNWGIECAIESEQLKGARVDVSALARKGKWTAIEVECSSGNETRNITSDLDAGYSAVVSLLKDHTRIDRVLQKLREEISSEKLELVTLGDLKDFETVLGQVLDFGPSTVAEQS